MRYGLEVSCYRDIWIENVERKKINKWRISVTLLDKSRSLKILSIISIDREGGD